MQYLHIPTGKIVEVEHMYSSKWYYADGDSHKDDFPYNFRPYKDYVEVIDMPLLALEPGKGGSVGAAEGNSPKIIHTATGEGLEFNLNQARSKTAIAEGVIGLGKTYGLAVLNNRPEGGYVGWADVAQRNKDLGVNWVEVEKDNPHVTF